MEPFTRNGFKIISAFDSEDEITKLSLMVLPENVETDNAYDVLLHKSLASISFKTFSQANKTLTFKEELVTVMEHGNITGAFEDSFEDEVFEIHRDDYSAHVILTADYDSFQGNSSFNKILVNLSNLTSSEHPIFFGYSDDPSAEFEPTFDYEDSTLFYVLEEAEDKIQDYAESFEKKKDRELELTA
jgi:hypothetical protein